MSGTIAERAIVGIRQARTTATNRIGTVSAIAIGDAARPPMTTAPVSDRIVGVRVGYTAAMAATSPASDRVIGVGVGNTGAMAATATISNRIIGVRVCYSAASAATAAMTHPVSV